MRKRVLIPLDGTKCAESALDAVKELCEKDDDFVLLKVERPEDVEALAYRAGLPFASAIMTSAGEVTQAVSADIPVAAETRDQSLEAQVNEARDYLGELAGGLRSDGYSVRTDVLIGEEPGAAIVEYARRESPDLIILVRRAHPGLIGMLLESVANHIIEAEVAPVLFVPPRA